MENKIKALPSWVRFTDFCPLKRAKIPHRQTDDRREYFAVLFQNKDNPAIQRAITVALAKAKTEQAERQAFKAAFKSAPAYIREQFPADTYQKPKMRLKFARMMKRYNSSSTHSAYGWSEMVNDRCARTPGITATLVVHQAKAACRRV
nr:MAG TPA: hypothetical protein [Caudoviricetes sp.]